MLDFYITETISLKLVQTHSSYLMIFLPSNLYVRVLFLSWVSGHTISHVLTHTKKYGVISCEPVSLWSYLMIFLVDGIPLSPRLIGLSATSL
jgi:hypothetical protein